ncbi:MAG: PqqD family protein [Caldilineaceae bacterium]
MHYRIDTPRVVHETLDEETIVIDFETGTYYSLAGTAHWVWILLEQNLSVAEIINQFIAHYPGDPEQIDAAVRQFIGELARAEIIVATATPQSVTASLPFSRQDHFAPPTLETYTDIQDLLLLDPIHEVGKQGWPMRHTP